MSHPQALYDTDPRLVMFIMHCGIPNTLGIPQCIINITNLMDVYLRGPEDDSVRVKTCSPKLIIIIGDPAVHYKYN